MIKLIRDILFPMLFQKSKNHTKDFLIMWIDIILGYGSLLLFVLFLFFGSPAIVDLGMSTENALLMDLLLSVLFFLQHSLLVRRKTRLSLAGLVPDAYYSAFYAVSSSITLIAVIIFWQKTTVSIMAADEIISWIIRALFLISMAGFAWGAISFGSFDAFGVKRILRHISNKPEKSIPITVKGAYRWMRHPMYFFTLVMIWACPVLTADRLLFNVLWSIWMIIGTMLEERDILKEHGSQYREYQSQVPMLIPYRIPRKTNRIP
jgi:protein-S-isoprenylcysteine O-methyltransferase Ste14